MAQVEFSPPKPPTPFPVWNKSPYNTSDCDQTAKAITTNITLGVTPTVTILTTSLGTAGWNGGVLAPNGNIYFAPGTADKIVKLNPVTDTFSLIGSSLGGLTGKYLSGVLAPNGYIYFMPGRNGNILKVDPNTDIVTTISAAYGNALANGCILSPQGNIYTVPQTNSSIVKLDTSTDTLSTIARPSVNISSNLWCGAILAEDGKIYMMPNSCNAVLELDPATDAMTTYVVYDTALRNQYLGAVLGPNGLMYGIPNEGFQMMTFNPISKEAVFTPSGGYCYGGTLGPDGVIYMNSFATDVVPTYNTLNNTYTNLSATGRPTSGYWYGGGGVKSANGTIYLSGNNTAGTFVKISFSGNYNPSTDWLLSRQINKF